MESRVKLNLKTRFKKGVDFAFKNPSWLGSSLTPKKLDLESFTNILPQASVGVSKTGTILMWNAAAENLFGWTAKEAIGRPMDELIIPVEYRSLHNQGMKRMLKMGETRVAGKYIDIQALDKNGKRVPIKLYISPIDFDCEVAFVGFIQENSKELEVQKELNLKLIESETLLSLLDLMTSDLSLDQILGRSLASICNTCNWELGHIYAKNIEGKWETTSDWHNGTGLPIDQLQDLSRELNYQTSPWCKKTLECINEIDWSENVQELKQFKRQSFCREFGIKGALSLPVEVKGETKYILEFFSLQPIEIGPRFIKVLSGVKEYVGKALTMAE